MKLEGNCVMNDKYLKGGQQVLRKLTLKQGIYFSRVIVTQRK